MAQFDRELIEILCPVPELEVGLGIIETGYIAGALSGLCLVGFELLGRVSVEAVDDGAVIALARSSRILGELGKDLAGYIPSIPPLEEVELTTLSGRLHEFSAEKVISTFGPSDTATLVSEQLIPLIKDCCSYYLGRCSDLSDQAFARMLESLMMAISEVEDLLATKAVAKEHGRNFGQKYSDILLAINLKQR